MRHAEHEQQLLVAEHVVAVAAEVVFGEEPDKVPVPEYSGPLEPFEYFKSALKAQPRSFMRAERSGYPRMFPLKAQHEAPRADMRTQL